MSSRLSIQALCGVALFLGSSTPSLAYDPYMKVPVVASQDPAFLRELLLRSSTDIVRIGVFGDSQESSPDFWGRHYIMEANALLVEAFGPVSETVILQQVWLDTEPNWLVASHNLMRQPAAQAQIPPVAVPPGMIVRARLGPADSVDAFHAVLMPNAERCVVTERIDSPWFLDGSNIVVDVLLSRRSTVGLLEWHGSIVESPHPVHNASALVKGTLSGQPPSGASVGWVTTGTLPQPTKGFRQVSLLGAHPSFPVDVLGARFRNAAQSRGVLLQPLAVGGASIGDLVSKHGASGPAIAALGLDAAILQFGANDAYLPASVWGSRLQKSIDLIRWAHGDPLFPILIVSDSHQRELPQGSDYDRLPGVAAAVAQANAGIIALNMRRVHEQAFLWNDAQNLGLADSVHHKPHAQRMLARAAISTMLETADIPVPGCAPGQSWVDRYYPLGGSCFVSLSCTVLVEADADSIGRPFVLGADCSDADADGRADICKGAASPDINGDGTVDGSDLGITFSYWGGSDPIADITRDGIVNGQDLGLILIFWGPLP
jgi:lysophospholipase L1-like esterase